MSASAPTDPTPFFQVKAALTEGFASKQFTLNCRGYFINGTFVDSITKSLIYRFSYLVCMFEPLSRDDVNAVWRSNTLSLLLDFVASPSKERWQACRMSLNKFSDTAELFAPECRCPVTGFLFRWSFDGEVFTIHSKFAGIVDRKLSYTSIEDFPHADGHLPKLTLDLVCPTGNLIFANVLHDVFGEGQDVFSYAVDREDGRRDQSLALLSKGAWHVYNSGRSEVYQNGDSLIIGHWPYDGDEHPTRPDEAVWLNRGDISGDLRWFYGCDEGALPEGWQTKLSHPDVEIFRVKVSPGTYRLINHYEHTDGSLRCTIEKVL